MPNITFTTAFTLGTTPPQFSFLDTTNYPAQVPTIANANVVGCFKIIAPSGITIYNNTTITAGGCDINIVASHGLQQVIALPLDSFSNPEQGVYQIIYSVWDSNLNIWYPSVTNTYTYTFIAPVVKILQTIDCLSPLFTSKDITNYAVDGIVPSISETHTIDYPYGSPGAGAPTVGSGLSLTTSGFWNGTQTTTISSILVYNYPDGLSVHCTITGSKEVVVDCTDICAIACCVRVLKHEMEECSNDAIREEKQELFTLVMGYVAYVKLIAIGCGKSAEVNCVMRKIREIANCTEDCSCSGTAPTQVTGLAGLVNQVVVNSCGTPIIVDSVTAGNTTTYTVCLSQTFINQVNSFLNTNVVGRNFITVTPSGPSGGVETFTIDGEDSQVESTDNSIAMTQVYISSGTLIIGKKYQIIVFQAGDDFSNIGATNANGNIFVATGTTPTTWTNGSTVNEYGRTIKDLSKNLHVLRNSTDFNTPYVVLAGVNTLTGCTLTVPATGTYLAFFEADAFCTLEGIQLVKYNLQNGSTPINDVRVLLADILATPGNGDQYNQKMMCISDPTACTLGDVITVKLDATLAMASSVTITGRSITFIKVG